MWKFNDTLQVVKAVGRIERGESSICKEVKELSDTMLRHKSNESIRSKIYRVRKTRSNV